MNLTRMLALTRQEIRACWWWWMLSCICMAIVAIQFRNSKDDQAFSGSWWLGLVQISPVILGLVVGLRNRIHSRHPWCSDGSASERLIATLMPLVLFIGLLEAAHQVAIWMGAIAPRRFNVTPFIVEIFCTIQMYACGMVAGLRRVRWTWLAPFVCLVGFTMVEWTLHTFLQAADHIEVMIPIYAVNAAIPCWWVWSLFHARSDGHDRSVATVSMLLVAAVGLLWTLSDWWSTTPLMDRIITWTMPLIRICVLPRVKHPIDGGSFAGWEAMALTGLALAVAAAVAWGLAWRRGELAHCAWAWALFAVATGPIGLLVQVAVLFPASRRPCPACGRNRFADAAACPACGSPWGDPAPSARAILKPAG